MEIDPKYCYCLSINDDRYEYTCSVFEKYGLSRPIKYPGFNKPDKKERCCLLGHMAIVMMARFLKYPYVFVYEDDAYPRKDIKQKLQFYFDNKPSNCGVIVFGRNGEYGRKIESIDGNYYIVCERPFGAHAYVVFEDCYDDFLSSLEKEKISDIGLKGNNYPNKKPYWTRENLFIQKNLDSNCMSRNLVEKYGHYFYPKENGCLGVFDSLPDSNWE